MYKKQKSFFSIFLGLMLAFTIAFIGCDDTNKKPISIDKGQPSTNGQAASLSITAPAHDARLTDTAPTIEWTYEKNDGKVASPVFYVGMKLQSGGDFVWLQKTAAGATNNLGAEAVANLVYNFATLTDGGTYTITVYAMESEIAADVSADFGTAVASASVEVTKPTPTPTPPSLSITAPAHDARLTDTAPTIEWTYEQRGGVETPVFYVGMKPASGGNFVWLQKTAAGATNNVGAEAVANLVYNFATLTDGGTYTITVYAMESEIVADASADFGTAVVSASVEVTKPTPTPASLSIITAPAHDARLTDTAPTIEWTYEKNDGKVARPIFYVGMKLQSGGDFVWLQKTAAGATNNVGAEAVANLVYNFETLTDGGTYTITVYAMESEIAADASADFGTAVVFASVEVTKPTPPSLSITAPAHDASLDADTPISWTYTKNDGEVDTPIFYVVIRDSINEVWIHRTTSTRTRAYRGRTFVPSGPAAPDVPRVSGSRIYSDLRAGVCRITVYATTDGIISGIVEVDRLAEVAIATSEVRTVTKPTPTPASLSITAPAHGARLTDTAPTIEWTYEKNDGKVASPVFYVGMKLQNGGDFVWLQKTAAGATNNVGAEAVANLVYNFATLTDGGTYTIIVYAMESEIAADAGADFGTAVASTSVEVTKPTPPSLSITAPGDLAEFEGNTPVSWTYTKNDGEVENPVFYVVIKGSEGRIWMHETTSTRTGAFRGGTFVPSGPANPDTPKIGNINYRELRGSICRITVYAMSGPVSGASESTDFENENNYITKSPTIRIIKLSWS